ncbi:cytochrome P450 [Lactarius deliciosus]|nr:cytochrome P450 [Lactarius deliciosus]
MYDNALCSRYALRLASFYGPKPASSSLELFRYLRSTSYSLQPTKKASEVRAINDFMTRLTRAGLPGVHLVEFLPWMMHIPSRFAKWKRDAEYRHEKHSTIFVGLFNNVCEKLLESIDSPSLVGKWIKDAHRYGISEREGAWLAGLTYTYIRAMVKEVLRWRPLDPLGLQHRSTENDWYNGMFILEGTTTIVNVWHLNRDPTIYGADAAHVNLARFLDVNGEVAPCPADTKEEGRHFSDNSLFIDIAMVLWACNIKSGKDEHGNVIPIDVDGWVGDEILVRPVSFKADISPRFPEAVTLLAGERELRSR